MSLLPDAVRREAFAEASRFRGEFYACLTARCDELFELVDSVLCADGAVKSPVGLTLLPEHRRGHGAMYGGLNHGRIDADRLRMVLAGLPLPRFDGGRLVLAVDVSPWLRSDAPCSAERLFCHVYGRAKTASQFIPGWPYSFVAVLEPGATSWTAILDAVRLGPVDDATAVTACLLALPACSISDEPPARRSDGVVKDFDRVTTSDVQRWVQKSDLPQETKSLIDLYVSEVRVTDGFGGCPEAEYTEPLMDVELAYPRLGQYDQEGLEEQRSWSRQIISGLERFAHTFEPGYFVDESLIGGPTWVVDSKGGVNCSGSIQMGQLLTPPANMGTDYYQQQNVPVR